MPWPAFKAPSRRGQHGNAAALLVFPLASGLSAYPKVVWTSRLGGVDRQRTKIQWRRCRFTLTLSLFHLNFASKK
jgi:hypothetical protein